MNKHILENALITGGSGMIGSNINFGHKPTSKTMDITDIKSIENYISNIEHISCIIHLAAINLRESENVKKYNL
jgi:dTDP-4-dehydrorhamnose reductase